jgi:hypothetical protein
VGIILYDDFISYNITMVEKLTIQERTPEQIKKEQEAEIMNGMKKSL